MPQRIVFAPETFNLAETTRAIEVARHLTAKPGCEVQFLGYSDEFAGLIREAGFRFRSLSPRLSREEARQLIRVDQGKGVRHPFTEDVVRRRVRAELAAYEEFGAEAVVIGATMSAFVSARAYGIPLVFPKPYAYSLPHLRQLREVPLLAGRGPVRREVNRAAAGLVRAVAPRVMWKPRAFRTVPREFGVALPGPTLAALEADHNLLTEIGAVLGADVARSLPANHRMVGPIFARLPGEVPERVLELAAGKRPLVYLALGSSGNRSLLMRLLRALERLPVEVIAPVRGYLGPDDPARVPRNVHLTELLPAHRLGPYIDASILHGGQGSVQTACLGGKPFVGLPLQLEQRFNVEACVRYGNAVRLSPATLTHAGLARALGRCLHSEPMRERARELAAVAAREDGAAGAARYLRELLPVR
ncbi:hypothetical protein MTQ01_12695 [Streptomyces sp. XM4193]|uniref:nucleotide disphospho-sugar-binding domain-containing protein n=1 Tax=Streptomyces sp. XM4193 TaxID=2929782 RepID=UPI001FFA0C53|nr:nucleotide disphospho-sugar-binding domain-containing protein [Streptomyces sp. XM4193]MCK1796858.1 hypothetical protein [Streptomyces sp. XM4193]